MSFIGTSSSGAPSTAAVNTGRRLCAQVLILGLAGFSCMTGTSAGAVSNEPVIRPSQTDAGHVAASPLEQPSALSELRKRTGFTWDQVAALFGVSRRAVHFWVSGKPMSAEHGEHLQRSNGSIRLVDRGSARENKDAFFEPGNAGNTPFDLLVARDYSGFVKAFSASNGHSTRIKPVVVSGDRLPTAPEVLFNSLEDTVHKDLGPARKVAVVRSMRA